MIGSTYPVNISYPGDSTFDIIDVGEDVRTFSPIRLTMEDYQDMMNDECMDMSKELFDKVISSCRKRLGKPKSRDVKKEPQKVMTPSCCEPKGFGK